MEMKILISLHVTYEVKPSLNGLFNFSDSGSPEKSVVMGGHSRELNGCAQAVKRSLFIISSPFKDLIITKTVAVYIFQFLSLH